MIDKGNSQDRMSRSIDKGWNKKQKNIPLIERDFCDLVSLKDQLKWIALKKQQQEKNKLK